MSNESSAVSQGEAKNLTFHHGSVARPRSLLRLSVVIIKLAKHLALIACLLIVEEASGRSTVGEVGILFLVLAAATLHLVGKSLQSGEAAQLPLIRLRS